MRFRAECSLAGKVYGTPFGVDVAFGDPIHGEPDLIVCDDVLRFAGIKPPTLPVYPVETHVAEKLHAYTMPRSRPNSRIKDLPDLALIASTCSVESVQLRDALLQTFDFRNTHSIPKSLPTPPATWENPYASIAQENQLSWPRLCDVFEAAQAFLDPVLATNLECVWTPTDWKWVAS